MRGIDASCEAEVTQRFNGVTEMNNKPVRRTQAIAPFGPGAIVDFTGPMSLMHAGLNVYPFDPRKQGA